MRHRLKSVPPGIRNLITWHGLQDVVFTSGGESRAFAAPYARGSVHPSSLHGTADGLSISRTSTLPELTRTSRARGWFRF